MGETAAMRTWTLRFKGASAGFFRGRVYYYVLAESGLWVHRTSWVRGYRRPKMYWLRMGVGMKAMREEVVDLGRGRENVKLMKGVPTQIQESLEKHGWMLNCPLSRMPFSNSSRSRSWIVTVPL
jgi:hypothetical protein